ncbi:hypothetical protein BpHYR1_004816 [Brachionus plicatilis]|uniref:Uncharacterized protein n=1 Tax=Brachionus plicatilis TaxID=10195 RepID=A0A3M7S8X3_BRAPC|nr:hypothetical protein BpHYR1_004816 [Brachionus plicatilis]
MIIEIIEGFFDLIKKEIKMYFEIYKRIFQLFISLNCIELSDLSNISLIIFLTLNIRNYAKKVIVLVWIIKIIVDIINKIIEILEYTQKSEIKK